MYSNIFSIEKKYRKYIYIKNFSYLFWVFKFNDPSCSILLASFEISNLVKKAVNNTAFNIGEFYFLLKILFIFAPSYLSQTPRAIKNIGSIRFCNLESTTFNSGGRELNFLEIQLERTSSNKRIFTAPRLKYSIISEFPSILSFVIYSDFDLIVRLASYWKFCLDYQKQLWTIFNLENTFVLFNSQILWAKQQVAAFVCTVSCNYATICLFITILRVTSLIGRIFVNLLSISNNQNRGSYFTYFLMSLTVQMISEI